MCANAENLFLLDFYFFMNTQYTILFKCQNEANCDYHSVRQWSCILLQYIFMIDKHVLYINTEVHKFFGNSATRNKLRPLEFGMCSCKNASRHLMYFVHYCLTHFSFFVPFCLSLSLRVTMGNKVCSRTYCGKLGFKKRFSLLR